MAALSDLIVEDGTGKVDSNTYISDADATAYLDLYGNPTYSASTDDERATALVNATQYVDLRWRFIGEIDFPATPAVAGQALCWPRSDANGQPLFDSKGNSFQSEVPFWIANATAEYALAYITNGRLAPDPTFPDPAGRAISSTRNKVGPIESEVSYDTSKAPQLRRNYTQGDQTIRESGLAIIAGDTVIRA